MTTAKCSSCGLFYKIQSMHNLNCQNHFVCKSCYNLNEIINCQLCNSMAINYVEPNRQQRSIYHYPVQGTLVHYDKVYNPKGESEFSSVANCHQRTAGWIMCNFLGLVFFFSGLSMAIKTDEVGIGVILTIIGLIGMIVSVYFICKVHKVDKYYDSKQYIDQDNFSDVKKKNRLTISSVKSSMIEQVQMIGTSSKLVRKT